jgi:hypothetical protein
VANWIKLPIPPAIIAILICSTTTSIVQAQQITAISSDFSAQAEAVRQSVINQPRDEYQPLGIRLGQLLGLDEGPFSPTHMDPKLTPLRPGEGPEKARQSFLR